MEKTRPITDYLKALDLDAGFQRAVSGAWDDARLYGRGFYSTSGAGKARHIRPWDVTIKEPDPEPPYMLPPTFWDFTVK